MKTDKNKKEVQIVEENAIIEIPQQQSLAPVAVNPYDKMIEMAITSDASMEKLEKFLELKERFENNEARKAYHAAMSEFKKVEIVIPKDAYNGQYKSWYTKLGTLVNKVVPVMSKFGLTHKWDIEQSENQMIKITCIVTHSLGFSDSVSISAPPDDSGKKNPIQKIKSTRTYLHSATFESILGLASTDANVDDDGNGNGSRTGSKPEVNSLVKLSPEYKALQDTKKLFPEEYEATILAGGGEPLTAEQCKQANESIQLLVDQKNNTEGVE